MDAVCAVLKEPDMNKTLRKVFRKIHVFGHARPPWNPKLQNTTQQNDIFDSMIIIHVTKYNYIQPSPKIANLYPQKSTDSIITVNHGVERTAANKRLVRETMG